MQENGAEQQRAWTAPVVWIVLAGLGTVICATIVGMAGYRSESAGVDAAYLVVFPLGFLCGGSLAALVGNFFLQGRVRLAAPFGCGLLAGVVALLMTFVFFVAIFPAL